MLDTVNVIRHKIVIRGGNGGGVDIEDSKYQMKYENKDSLSLKHCSEKVLIEGTSGEREWRRVESQGNWRRNIPAIW